MIAEPGAEPQFGNQAPFECQIGPPLCRAHGSRVEAQDYADHAPLIAWRAQVWSACAKQRIGASARA
jgi:hypothetical protein